MCALYDQDTKETLTLFLKEFGGFGSIRERHRVREDKIEELMLFCEPDKSKIVERKKCVRFAEREVSTGAGRDVTKRQAV